MTVISRPLQAYANVLQLCEGGEFIFSRFTYLQLFNKDNLLKLYSSALLLQSCCCAFVHVFFAINIISSRALPVATGDCL